MRGFLSTGGGRARPSCQYYPGRGRLPGVIASPEDRSGATANRCHTGGGRDFGAGPCREGGGQPCSPRPGRALAQAGARATGASPARCTCHPTGTFIIIITPEMMKVLFCFSHFLSGFRGCWSKRLTSPSPSKSESGLFILPGNLLCTFTTVFQPSGLPPSHSGRNLMVTVPEIGSFAWNSATYTISPCFVSSCPQSALSFVSTGVQTSEVGGKACRHGSSGLNW